LGERTAIDFHVVGFRGQQKLDRPFDDRGLYGALAFYYALKSDWMLSWGGDYGKNDTSIPSLNLSYQRIYVSFLYSRELWRGER